MENNNQSLYQRSCFRSLSNKETQDIREAALKALHEILRIIITLRSQNDGEMFVIDKKLLSQASVLIKNILVAARGDIVPLAVVDGATLRKIIDWIRHNYSANGGYRGREELPWNVNFFNDDPHKVARMLKAADYLDMPEFLRMGTLFMARMLTEDGDAEFGQQLSKMEDLSLDAPVSMELLAMCLNINNE